jgi:hypothetical protein
MLSGKYGAIWRFQLRLDSGLQRMIEAKVNLVGG